MFARDEIDPKWIEESDSLLQINILHSWWHLAVISFVLLV